jgi:FMN reductase
MLACFRFVSVERAVFMSVKKLVFVAGSPSEESRSSRVAKEVERYVRRKAGVDAVTFSLHDFDPKQVWYARSEAPEVQRFVREVTSADGVVLSTPVYKATYTGALKSIVDLIPPDALEGKIALFIATGRRAALSRCAARAFAELFGFFRIGRVVPGIQLTDDVLFSGSEPDAFGDVAREHIERAARELIDGLSQGEASQAAQTFGV